MATGSASARADDVAALTARRKPRVARTFIDLPFGRVGKTITSIWGRGGRTKEKDRADRCERQFSLGWGIVGGKRLVHRSSTGAANRSSGVARITAQAPAAISRSSWSGPQPA